ncbi:MAG: hypothetical protein U0694_18505 [Anaerolineae bacterium]
MGSGNDRIYNIISIVFLLLTVGVFAFVVARLASPAPQDPNALTAAGLPTPLSFPTFTPSPLVPTLPPTFTLTPTDTPTLAPTLTETPRPLPSSTITDTPAPTFTPSITPTPSTSPTFTAQPSPTGPTATLPATESPYPFTLFNDQIQFMANFAAPSAGCLWQGIGGRVRGLDGNEVAAGSFNVLVFDATNTFSQTVPVGSNTQYGSISGWEVRVGDQISPSTYFVTLYTASNVQVSERIQVTFPSNCNENLAFLDLVRVR